jgi:hypothetical protein
MNTLSPYNENRMIIWLCLVIETIGRTRMVDSRSQ